MKHDLLADMFSTLKNAETIGKGECIVPSSRLIRSILSVMEGKKYIGGTEESDEFGPGKIKVKLVGRINNCNVIKPSHSVRKADFIKFEKRYLPARDIGMLIVTTSAGVMDQKEAEKKGTGGRLLGYVY